MSWSFGHLCYVPSWRHKIVPCDGKRRAPFLQAGIPRELGPARTLLAVLFDGAKIVTILYKRNGSYV